MKILNAEQKRQADRQTIEREGITSLQLMERAGEALATFLLQNYPAQRPVVIYCGRGNNGGDGLVVARKLQRAQRQVKVLQVLHSEKSSEEFQENLQRLQAEAVSVENIQSSDDFAPPPKNALLIDAIFGSGLSRPLEGLVEDLIDFLNELPNERLSLDMPTGLFVDSNKGNDLDKIFRADTTLAIQQPALSFFHRHTAALPGQLVVIDIGIDPKIIQAFPAYHHYINLDDIAELYLPRQRFSYKNTYGHLLVVAGSEGMAGAAILCAGAAARAGAGLVSVYSGTYALLPLQTALPEVMFLKDSGAHFISDIPELKPFSAIAAGPGMGTKKETREALRILLSSAEVPLVLDADALNILAENPDFMKLLPEESILTPHIGEFRRLLALKDLPTDYLELLQKFSLRHKVNVVLKDSITTVASSRGELFFIDEGSPALATAGSGDVLTGIIGALLAGRYSPLHACLCGVWLHGRAGMLAGRELSEEATMAGDISRYLSTAYRELSRHHHRRHHPFKG